MQECRPVNDFMHCNKYTLDRKNIFNFKFSVNRITFFNPGIFMKFSISLHLTVYFVATGLEISSPLLSLSLKVITF